MSLVLQSHALGFAPLGVNSFQFLFGLVWKASSVELEVKQVKPKECHLVWGKRRVISTSKEGEKETVNFLEVTSACVTASEGWASPDSRG